MTTFKSNEEFFSALREQIERWCDKRQLSALARVLPAYIAFNGLTDSWADLRDALRTTQSLGRNAIGAEESDLLDDLIRAADRALTRG